MPITPPPRFSVMPPGFGRMTPGMPGSPSAPVQGGPRPPAGPPKAPVHPGLKGAAGKSAAQSDVYLGTDAISGYVNELYKLLSTSPAFANALRLANQQGSQVNTGVKSALGRTGLSDTGVGATMGAIGNTAATSAASNVRSQAFQQAIQTAMEALIQRLNFAQGTMAGNRRGPSDLEKLGGFLVGAGNAAGGIIPG